MTTTNPLTKLGPWLLEGPLGRGGQGSTFRARHEVTGATAAVKRFRVADMAEWKRYELFEREAKTLAALEHPAIPRFLGSGAEGDGTDLWIAMELVEGEPLAKRLGAPQPLEVLQRLFAEALDVLSYLHTRAPPVLHRDIKPHNMIVRADGRLVLVDFGSVRTALAPDGGSTVVGTFGYLAPEQLHGAASPASDLYSLGVTMIALATGIDGASLPRRGLRIEAERVLSGVADVGLCRAWAAMVEPDPEQRPRDVAAVRALLTPPASFAAFTPAPGQGPWPFHTWTPRGRLGRFALMLLLLVMRFGVGVMHVLQRTVLPAVHRRQHERIDRQAQRRRRGPDPVKLAQRHARLEERHTVQRERLRLATDQVQAFSDQLRADNRLPPARHQQRLPRGRRA